MFMDQTVKCNYNIHMIHRFIKKGWHVRFRLPAFPSEQLSEQCNSILDTIGRWFEADLHCMISTFSTSMSFMLHELQEFYLGR